MKIITTLLSFAVIAVFVWNGSAAAQFAGGSGTEEDPWQIETAEHLDQIREFSGFDYSEVFFSQIQDIDLSGFLWDGMKQDYINEGRGWIPIGDLDDPFLGTYLGNGYEISGLVVHRPDEYYQGLFGVAYYARFDNIRLSGVDITGYEFVGGLSGNFYDTMVSEIHVSGEISAGGDFSGGLVGSISQGEITNCHTDVKLTGQANVGGVTGMSALVSIKNCSNTGDVTAEGRAVGGLAGEQIEASLENSSNSGTVVGMDWHTGGLVGKNENSSIHNSYNTGDVTGMRHHTGGLAGTHDAESVIRRSYSAGNVSGEGHSTGGLVGRNFGIIENSYSTGSVSGNDNYTGGLVGHNRSEAMISKTYSTADVNGHWYTGGLVGYSVDATVSTSFSRGTVKGEGNSVGGLIGATLGGILRNNFSRSDVEGVNWVGGLVGYNGVEDLTVVNCYSTGQVISQEDDAGGLLGFLDGGTGVQVEGSYWNEESSGQYASEDAEGRTTDHMTYPYGEETYTGWDFEEIWTHDTDHTLNEGYPFLMIESTVTRALDPESVQEIIQNITLAQNYPNPFNPATRIRYLVPEQAHVRLVVYDVLGQQVATLVNEQKSPGKYEVTFDATALSSGIYLYRLQTERHAVSRQMLLVK